MIGMCIADDGQFTTPPPSPPAGVLWICDPGATKFSVGTADTKGARLTTPQHLSDPHPDPARPREETNSVDSIEWASVIATMQPATSGLRFFSLGGWGPESGVRQAQWSL